MTFRALIFLLFAGCSTAAPSNKTINLQMYDTSRTPDSYTPLLIAPENNKVLGYTTADGWHMVTPASGSGLGDLLSTNNLSDVGSAPTSRANLGLTIGTHVQAFDVDLSIYAGITPSANIQSLLGSADYSAARVLLSLGNVTNTSDANKPVSTAQQTALDLKANLASPALTGVPTAPTAASGTSTTQVATTAYVATDLALKQSRGLIRVSHQSGAADTVYTPSADTDAARGTILRTAFSANTAAGDHILAYPGTYAVADNRLLLAASVNFTLAAGGKITSACDMATDGAIICPGNNSIIDLRGATIEGIGAGSGFQAAIGIVEDVGDTAKTGWQVFGGTLIGDSDGFYIQHTTPCTGRLWSTQFATKWDSCTITGSDTGDVAHLVDVYNPRVDVIGPSGTGSQQARGFVAFDGATLRVFGGSASVTLGGTTGNDGAYAARNGVVELHDVAIRTANGGNPKFDLTNVSGTIKVSGGSGSGTNGSFTTSGTITVIGSDYARHRDASNLATGTVPPAQLGSGSSITTKFLRGDSTWQTISGGGNALVESSLAQFAATTSAELAGVLSNETGTGLAVFGTSPGFTTAINPSSNDAAALGTASLGWADLFLATGGTIRFANTDWVGTHSTGAFTVTAGDLRVTTAGTDPTSVLTLSGTQTITGKSIAATQLTGNISVNRLSNAFLAPDAFGTGTPNLVSGTTITATTAFSGPGTSLTGTAAGLTAGNVTTNANLTGHVTSTGNAAVLGSFTHAQLNTAVSDANLLATDGNGSAVTALNGSNVASGTVALARLPATLSNGDIVITIGNGTDVISAGVQGFLYIPTARTVVSVEMVASDAAATAGAIVVDVWEDSYTNYPPANADSITASDPPTITATAAKSQDSDVSTWDTSIAAGSYLGFNVDSVTSMKRVTLILKCTK